MSLEWFNLPLKKDASIELFKKNATNGREMNFEEFQLTLEKIAEKINETKINTYLNKIKTLRAMADHNNKEKEEPINIKNKKKNSRVPVNKNIIPANNNNNENTSQNNQEESKEVQNDPNSNENVTNLENKTEINPLNTEENLNNDTNNNNTENNTLNKTEENSSEKNQEEIKMMRKNIFELKKKTKNELIEDLLI